MSEQEELPAPIPLFRISEYPQVLCVGARFRGPDAVSACRALTTDTPLTLEREPLNAYDENAIKVKFADQHIGYVARDIAAWIAPEMDSGRTATVVFTGDFAESKTVVPILSIRVE